MTALVLASSSKYRQQLLANIGIHAESSAPDIDESPLPDESPLALCKRLASEKAKKIALQHPGKIVIGSDQVASVEIEDRKVILGKPGTVENAVEQLKMCQGKAVYFYTALSLCQSLLNTTSSAMDNPPVNLATSKINSVTRAEETCVYFRTHSESQLRRYVECEMPLDCAGSFKCEGMGILLFERITSRDPNTLIGLPVMLLHNMLDRHFNIDLLDLATETPYYTQFAQQHN